MYGMLYFRQTYFIIRMLMVIVWRDWRASHIAALWIMKHTKKEGTLIALAFRNATVRLQYYLIMFIKIDFVTWTQGFRCT